MKPILKTIIMAKLVALLITGLTCFISTPEMTYSIFKSLPSIHIGEDIFHIESWAAIYTAPKGLPIAYVSYPVAAVPWFYPINFVIDFLIFFAACFAIAFILSNEWERNHKIGKKTKYEER